MSHMLSERAPRRGTEARRAASWRQLPPERKCTGIAQNCKEHIHKNNPSHCIPRAPSDCPAGRRTAGTGCTERAFSTRVTLMGSLSVPSYTIHWPRMALRNLLSGRRVPDHHGVVTRPRSKLGSVNGSSFKSSYEVQQEGDRTRSECFAE